MPKERDDRPLSREMGEPLKCELIEDKGGPAGTVSLATGSRDAVHRFLPRAAPPGDGEDQGVQAALDRRRATGSATSSGPQMQRIYGTASSPRRSSTVAQAAGGGEQARPPQARARARISSASRRRSGPGLALWHPERRGHPEADGAVSDARALRGAATASSTRRTSAQFELWETSGHSKLYRDGHVPAMQDERRGRSTSSSR